MHISVPIQMCIITCILRITETSVQFYRPSGTISFRINYCCCDCRVIKNIKWMSQELLVVQPLLELLECIPLQKGIEYGISSLWQCHNHLLNFCQYCRNVFSQLLSPIFCTHFCPRDKSTKLMKGDINSCMQTKLLSSSHLTPPPSINHFNMSYEAKSEDIWTYIKCVP